MSVDQMTEFFKEAYSDVELDEPRRVLREQPVHDAAEHGLHARRVLALEGRVEARQPPPQERHRVLVARERVGAAGRRQGHELLGRREAAAVEGLGLAQGHERRHRLRLLIRALDELVHGDRSCL